MRKIIFSVASMMMLSAAAQASEEVSANELRNAKERVARYIDKVDQDSMWLASRLQMYWATNASTVYINGESFDHAGGPKAPYPTVKFNGTRSTASAYNRPKLEDVIPYDDDEQSSVTFISRSTGKMEKTHPSKTGCNIDGLNREIIGYAKAAAAVYAAEGDEKYASMAATVLDTYLKGIAGRNGMPQDLNHGHQQSIVGMVTFEVIHDDALSDLAEIKQRITPYIRKRKLPEDIYDEALKKWADVIIANGVPHNNWDLFQAEHISNAAMALKDNAAYGDGKGKQYYLDFVMHGNGIRQWGMTKLADFGFDNNTGVWYESPGYSTTVLADFAKFADKFDKQTGIDMFQEIPQLRKGLMTEAQYLYPSRIICGFGDTHPGSINRKGIEKYIEYAKRHGKSDEVSAFTALNEALKPEASTEEVEKYVSGCFYAPNVSWLTQRTGMDAKHDLMLSLNGSLGNHQHANGISLEMYGKGYVLAPDAGIGKHLYSGLDYSEYYSQMPAHNTVVVDGVSSYPVMMSQHAFKVDGCYPESGKLGKFEDATYAQVSFVEPESQSDQQRTTGIVKTSDKGGYYVDIFRSRKKEGGDKMHDYFYHNMGQQMTLTDSKGGSLGLQPTDELAFAGGHLYAYSYIYDKKSATTDKDIQAVFTVNCSDGRRIDMTMWMRGSKDREIFQALSPVNLEYERMKDQPYKIDEQPVLTFVARQKGEAWTKPFTAIFEPSDSNEPSEIESVEFFTPKSSSDSATGIIVHLKNGSTDHIFSAPEATKMTYGKISVNAAYAVFRDGKRIL